MEEPTPRSGGRHRFARSTVRSPALLAAVLTVAVTGGVVTLVDARHGRSDRVVVAEDQHPSQSVIGPSASARPAGTTARQPPVPVAPTAGGLRPAPPATGRPRDASRSTQRSGSPTAATPPAGGGTHIGNRNGTATHYTLNGAGNCSYPSPPANDLYVALPPGEYASAAACGAVLDVTGPRGTVRVTVVDQCPECEAGHIDLSTTAFSKIADPAQGIISVSYAQLADPPLPGPLTVRVKEGSSQYWLAVLIQNTGNPLSSVDARSGPGSWQRLGRADYNYWLAESGVGPGPLTLRITDSRGHQRTVSGITLSPGSVQSTRVWMY
jgi:expansin